MVLVFDIFQFAKYVSNSISKIKYVLRCCFCSSRQDTVENSWQQAHTGMVFWLWVCSLNSLLFSLVWNHQCGRIWFELPVSAFKNFQLLYYLALLNLLKSLTLAERQKGWDRKIGPFVVRRPLLTMSKCFSEIVFNLYCSLCSLD